VLIGEQRKRGTIVRLDKKIPSGNIWLVEAGDMKISFPEKDLIPLPQKEKKSNHPAAGWAAEISSQADLRVELNLRGMRMEEALLALRRQIDGAVIAGLKEFSVVHGKGDGILQKGVHEYLKGESVVADYYFSRPEMGGFGRTEVILK
jgi:DNA mismatch repair protein MutS2